MEGTGDRRRGQCQYVDRAAHRFQAFFVFDTESLLFVDDEKS